MTTQWFYDSSAQRFHGLSTDIKPTDCTNGSVFVEIDTAKIYLFDKAALTWHAIPASGSETYTKAEIDSLISDVQDAADNAQDTADAAQTASGNNKEYIGILAAQAGKNRLTADQTTQTIDTATITANGDGTYHIETSIATTQQVVFTLGTAILHTGIEYIITGITNGSPDTYFLNYDKSTAAGTGNQNVYVGRYQIATGEVERLTTVKFYIRSGQQVNVDISPMILEKQWYSGFPEFTPYQITLRDQNRVITAALNDKADLSIFTPISESAYEALTVKDKPLYFIYEDE